MLTKIKKTLCFSGVLLATTLMCTSGAWAAASGITWKVTNNLTVPITIEATALSRKIASVSLSRKTIAPGEKDVQFMTSHHIAYAFKTTPQVDAVRVGFYETNEHNKLVGLCTVRPDIKTIWFFGPNINHDSPHAKVSNAVPNIDCTATLVVHRPAGGDYGVISVLLEPHKYS